MMGDMARLAQIVNGDIEIKDEVQPGIQVDLRQSQAAEETMKMLEGVFGEEEIQIENLSCLSEDAGKPDKD